MTITEETLAQNLDMVAAMTRSIHSVKVESLADSGEWISREFSDEKTAAHYEKTMARRSVETRRPL